MGIIVLIEGIAMIVPWIWAECAGETESAFAFRICVPLTLLLGFLVSVCFRSGRTDFGVREGYIVVALAWVIASVIGMFPYILSGTADDLSTAFFESAAGFTTTGCTCINGDLTSHSLLLWKALSNWLGGMGILVFVISVLPALGVSGQFIVRAETPGPVYEKTTVRIKNSTRVLYATYISFTLLAFVFLCASDKVCLYDSIVLSLGSVSTGGVAIHSEGMAYYDSVYVESVVSFFCFFASVNFILYYNLIVGNVRKVLKDIELRAFFAVIAIGTLLCAIGILLNTDLSLTEAVRESLFQVVNVSSTSGYTKNVTFGWPTACQFVLLAVMIIGGCSASTAGSLKVVRFLVMLKLIGRGVIRRIHPRSVVAVKLGGESVSAPIVSAITVFIMAYFGLIFLTVIILSIQGLDAETNITTAIAMISNTGAAFTHHICIGNFSMFNAGSKFFLSLLMITGRLELFTIIIFFTRIFWGKKR